MAEARADRTAERKAESATGRNAAMLELRAKIRAHGCPSDVVQTLFSRRRYLPGSEHQAPPTGEATDRRRLTQSMGMGKTVVQK